METRPEGGAEPTERRSFLATAAMGAGLLAAYGTFAAMSGRFLYPARPRETAWLFVRDLRSMKPGDSLVYRTPAGATVAVARLGAAGTSDDFLALSSTCPHLGCQVHWESANRRFFCPCHNGVFDPSGKAVSGPPADAGQDLPRYPLDVVDGLLYIQVPTERLQRSGNGFRAAPAGPPGRCGGGICRGKDGRA
jgi:Rieske Fe-S protein